MQLILVVVLSLSIIISIISIDRDRKKRDKEHQEILERLEQRRRNANYVFHQLIRESFDVSELAPYLKNSEPNKKVNWKKEGY